MMLLGFLQNIGPVEGLLILAAILLVFGAGRIPQIARSLGKSTGEFKKGLREGGKDEKQEEDKPSEKG